jgi:hypothetical protein
MSNSIRTGLHFSVADTILKEIQYQRSNYFFFLGKIDKWLPDDVYVSADLINSDYENNSIRTNILYINKVAPTDVSLVTKRTLWTTSTVYDQYDHTKDLNTLTYFVVTDEYNVYKCLSNNNGAVSTIKPVGKPTIPLKLSDGYVWKYMYAIPSFKKSKFMSYSYIPVQTALSDSFYNNGSIDDVIVEFGGSGYTDAPNVTISLVGQPVAGFGATGHVQVDGNGHVTGVVISNGGTGYIAGVRLSITSSTGAGAEITANITGGVIQSANIVKAGVSYTSGDTVNFILGGAILVPGVSQIVQDGFGAYVSGGNITKVTIVDPGIGYATAPALTVVSANATGTGRYGAGSALITAIVYQGKIVQVNILDSGMQYANGIGTNISVFGDGTGAKFTPVIYNGSIVDVVVDNPGQDYSEVIVSISAANFAVVNAKITPVLASSDFSSDQYVIEQTSVPGAIYSVVITNPGTNYTANATVAINGDGTGATGTVSIVDGKISKITMTTFGQNYTYANVVITDSSRTINITNVEAVAYAIMPPKYGHGRDAVKELSSSTIAFTNVIKKDPSIVNLAQDYRYFGLVKNPKNVLTGEMVRVQNSVIAHYITFNNVTGLVLDEILLKDSTKFRVVVITNNDVTLQPLGYGYITSAGTYIAEADSNRTYVTTAVTSTPVIDKYSGDLLFASAENPFTFTADQTFIIKTFLTV